MILKKLFLLFCTLAIGAWIFGFVFFTAFALGLTPQQPETKTQAIIVLTGGNNRIQTGLDLLEQGLAPVLFITGVHHDYKPSHIFALWHGDPKIAKCCITLDYNATTTIENAQETQNWIQKNNISTARVVTSKYHMLRALLEIKAKNPKLKVIFHPVMQSDIGPLDLYFWHVIVSEYHKFLWRWAVLTINEIAANYEA